MNPTDMTSGIMKAIVTFFDNNRLYGVAAIAVAVIVLFVTAYHFILKRAPRTWRLALSLTAGACGLVWGLTLLEILFIPSSTSLPFLPYAMAILFAMVAYGLLSVFFQKAFKERPYSLRKAILVRRLNFVNRAGIAADKLKTQRESDLIAAKQEERRRKAAVEAFARALEANTGETPEERSARMSRIIDEGLESRRTEQLQTPSQTV